MRSCFFIILAYVPFCRLRLCGISDIIYLRINNKNIEMEKILQKDHKP
jgi:hypothetical protein